MSEETIFTFMAKTVIEIAKLRRDLTMEQRKNRLRYKKQGRIFEKDINELKEHKHPEIIGKKEIYNLDFISKNVEEVLRELNDRLIETLSGEIEDQSLEWFIKESTELLEKLDSQGKSEKHITWQGGSNPYEKTEKKEFWKKHRRIKEEYDIQ